MTEKESQYTIGHLVAAYADAGLIVMRSQLWGPARDGDHLALTALLALDPWTVDEPGRVGEGFTSALQVACAGGHVECVEVLLKHRAIFRDKDWQSTPRPFVCASMLTGAGYYDGGKPPGGILHFHDVAGRQARQRPDFLYYRTPHLGDGHQRRSNGHPLPNDSLWHDLNGLGTRPQN